jgi:hypothetical protein
MSAVTVMSGLEEVERRRLIARALGELLEDLDDRQHGDRRDVGPALL